MTLLMVGSSWMVAFSATASVQVDDVRPGDFPAAGSAVTTDNMPKVETNVSQWENVNVTVDTTLEWQAGTVPAGMDTSGGAVSIPDNNREGFGGTGDLDSNFWEWGDQVTQNGGFLVMQSDTAGGDNHPFVRLNRSLRTYDLSQMDGLELNTSSRVLSMSNPNMGIDALGWWDGSYKFGIRYVTDPSGGLTIDMYSYGPTVDDQPNIDVPFNQLLALQIVIYAGNNSAEGFALINSSWVSLGVVTTSFTSHTHWSPFFGRQDAMCCGEDFVMEVDYIESSQLHLRPDAATYASAQFTTGLGVSYIQMMQLNLSSGVIGGVSGIQYRTARTSSALANATWMPITPNTGVDEQVDLMMQFRFTIQASPLTAVDRVSFELEYHHDVMLLRMDDFNAGSLNTDTWTGDVRISSGHFELSSSTDSSANSIWYNNATFDLSLANNAEAYAMVENMDGLASGDQNMLLGGFAVTDGAGNVTDYAGLVRMGGGFNGRYGLTHLSASGGLSNVTSTIDAGGATMVHVMLDDGVVSAQVLVAGVGWADVGSVDLALSAGTAHLVFGYVGAPSGTQTYQVDWVGFVERHLVPALGESWETGTVPLGEDSNSFAIFAVEGPESDLQPLTYVKDTTPPVGTFTVNGGSSTATSLVVDLQLSATDKHGVAFYAASESLSFPEGWKPYPSNGQATFLLSSGDGRKVVWVRFMDNSGLISTPNNRTLFLDTVDPTGALYLNDRASTTSAPDVDLTLLAFDAGGVDHAEVRNAGDPSPTVIDLKTNGTAQQAVTRVIPWTLSSGDGVKTVNVVYFDSAGRSSGTPAYNASILLDSTAPSLTATLLNTISRDNTLYLNTTVATVRVSASDASGVQTVLVSEDPTFATGRSYPTAGDLIFDLPAGSGARTLYVSALDVYGLQSDVVQIDFFVDVAAPTGSIVINNDDEVTTSRTVQLQLEATDNIAVADMQLSTSLYFLGSVWQPYSDSASLDLSAGDGPQKTVYVRFRDVNGRESQAFFDTIALDTTPPSGFIIVNNGDVETIDRNLNLQLEAFDNFEGTLEMRVATSASDLSAANWQPFSENFRIDAGTEAGNVTVYYQIRDVNGLVSETYTDSIRVRLATCADTDSCNPVAQPGFEGAYALVAIGAVAIVAVLGRRRRDEL